MVRNALVLVFAFGCGVDGVPGDPGEMGDPGTAGPQGPQGPMGEPGMIDPAQAILNSKTLQSASFHIDGDGLIGNKVGIGTAAPNAQLHVSSNADAQAILSTFSDVANRQSYLFLDRARGTAASPASVALGDEIGRLYGRGFSAGSLRDATIIKSVVDGTPSMTAVPGALAFETSNGATPPSERMRITASGSVGIGTSTPGARLEVAGGDLVLNHGASGNPEVRLIGDDASEGANLWYENDTGDVYLDQIYGPAGKLHVRMGTAAGAREALTVAHDGNVGIGTTSPFALLSVGPQLAGAVLSRVLDTNAGPLATAIGSELALASIGFQAGNNSNLGIRARRTATGSDWTTTAIGLGMDVDNTVRAGGASVWLSSNGGVGIGTATPLATLDVAGGIRTSLSGTTVQTHVPNGSNTIVHNLNLPANRTQLIFITNGHHAANGFMVMGTNSFGPNSFSFVTTGGAGGLARFNWVIFLL